MSSTSVAALSGRERQTLSRAHHLKRKRFIEPLFDRSDPSTGSIASGCIRLMFRQVNPDSIVVPFQIGVAVGKSTGTAVRRNRIRRIIWEAVRLDQNLLLEAANTMEGLLTAMLLDRGRNLDSETITRDTRTALGKLNVGLAKHALLQEQDET